MVNTFINISEHKEQTKEQTQTRNCQGIATSKYNTELSNIYIAIMITLTPD